MIGSRPPTGPLESGAQLLIYCSRLTRGSEQVHVTGEVDLATCPQLRAALMAAVDRGGARGGILIDLAGVSFLDARGIGVLVETRLAAHRSGMTFAVQNPRGVVRRVLEVSRPTTGFALAPRQRSAPAWSAGRG
jgi:anti-sigma B factor antagonist